MYTIDNSSFLETFENVDISGVVNIIPADPNIAEPAITSITVTRGAQYTFGTNIAINTSANTVTISGRYNGNFTSGIAYLDKDSKPATAQKFTDVPSDFSTVISYTPSSVSSGDAIYTISVNGIVAGNVTQTVINNYSTGRDALIALVAKGKF